MAGLRVIAAGVIERAWFPGDAISVAFETEGGAGWGFNWRPRQLVGAGR